MSNYKQLSCLLWYKEGGGRHTEASLFFGQVVSEVRSEALAQGLWGLDAAVLDLGTISELTELCVVVVRVEELLEHGVHG